MKYILLILFTGLIVSCVAPKSIPDEVASEIPKDAQKIEVYSNKTASDFYNVIYKELAKDGFSIINDNKEQKTLSTDYKELEQEATVNINVIVEESDNGSVATLQGKWGVSGAMSAAFNGMDKDNTGIAKWSKGRPKIAFGKISVFANDLENENIKYLK